MVKSSSEDDIHTAVWVNPVSGDDHSITVMRCGDDWWSYVDTVRISEVCVSKEEAIKTARLHLEQRRPRVKVKANSSKTPDTPSQIQHSTLTARPSLAPGVLAVSIIAAMIGMFASASLFSQHLGANWLADIGTTAAKQDSFAPQDMLPPLPSRKAVNTAAIKTGAIRHRPKVVAITNQRTASRADKASGTRAPITIPVEAPTAHTLEDRLVYRPVLEQADPAPSRQGAGTLGDLIGLPQSGPGAVRAIERSAVVTSSAVVDPPTPTAQSRSITAQNKRKIQRSIKRSRKKKARRRYRGRKLVSVRRVRIGGRIVKIVRFRRPRNLREYRRLQAARNRLIANHIRQRRRRYGR